MELTIKSSSSPAESFLLLWRNTELFSSEVALQKHQQFQLLYFFQVFQDLSTAITRISAPNFSSSWSKKGKSKNNIQFCTYKHNLGNITISGYLKTNSLYAAASIKNTELQYLKVASTFRTVDSCWPQISNSENYCLHCPKYYKTCDLILQTSDLLLPCPWFNSFRKRSELTVTFRTYFGIS